MLVETSETQAVETDTEPIPRAESPPEASESKSEYSDLIARLVSDRQAEDEAAKTKPQDAFDNIRTHHRDLEPLRTEEIYIFGITINVGVGSLTIRCKEIDLNPDLTEVVEAAEGSYIITIPTFKGLTKRGTKLATARTKIQKRFMRFANPYWYVCKKDMTSLRDEVMELIQLADQLKAEALAVYDDEFALFLSKLSEVFIKAGKADRLEFLLELYAGHFPTREEIATGFNVLLEGPIKIPSLIEEADRNADLAAALAREEEARVKQRSIDLEEELLEQKARFDRQKIRDAKQLHQEQIEAQRKLQEREEQAIRELQACYIKSLQESFAIGIKQAQDDAYGLIADLLKTIEGIEDPARIRHATKQGLDGKLQQLLTAVNQIATVNNGEFDSKLPAFAEKVRQIKVLTTSSVSPERLKERISELRSTMSEELAQVFSSPKKGHRALAQWMLLEDNEDDQTEE